MPWWLVAFCFMPLEAAGRANNTYAGTCLHGHLIAEEERSQDDHCGSCEAGFYLYDKYCKAYAGSCEHGHLKPQKDRTRENHCESCEPGYHLHQQLCKAYAGSCLHGHLKIQKDRTQENHCGSCEPGYYLLDERCKAYLGSCEHGDLIAQKDRTHENHCGSCEAGYRLHAKLCELCPEGRYSYQGVHKQCKLCPKGTYSFQGVCTGCNLLQWILDQEEWNSATMHRPRDLEGCKETAIFRLVQAKHFRNRRHFAVVLKELDASFHSMKQGKTPIAALVQHCDAGTDSDWLELRQLLKELIKHKADLRTGSPMDVAANNGCHGLVKIIRDHSKPEEYFERWKYACSHKTPVFIGPTHVFSISLVWSVTIASMSAVVVGVLTHGLLQSADDIEQQLVAQVWPCTAAREMAALAHCFLWEERFQKIMGVLSVVARIVFPLHVCMSTITFAAFLPMYFLYLVLPTFFDQSHNNNFASLGIPSRASCSLLRHGFAIARQLFLSSLSALAAPSEAAIAGPIILYTLSAIAATSGVVWDIKERAQLVPLPLQPWYWMRARAMGALQSEHLIFRNIRSELILNPYNLAHTEAPFNVQMLQIPTRSLYCCFEPLVGYLSVIWCILSLYLLIKNRCLGSHKVQPDLQTLAEKTQRLSERKWIQKISQLTGVKGDLGKFERFFLKTEKLLACGLTSASHFTLKASSDDVERNVRPCSKTTIRIDLFLFFIGMCLDVLQIHNLYWNKCHAFGGVMLFLFIWVLTVQLVRCDICALIKEVGEIDRHGMKTETYMRIMRWEKGFESFFKLMFTAYAIHFSITNTTNLLTSSAGLFFSVWGFALYIFQKGYLKAKYDESTAQHALQAPFATVPMEASTSELLRTDTD